jgi:hypothetical protein
LPSAFSEARRRRASSSFSRPEFQPVEFRFQREDAAGGTARFDEHQEAIGSVSQLAQLLLVSQYHDRRFPTRNDFPYHYRRSLATTEFNMAKQDVA